MNVVVTSARSHISPRGVDTNPARNQGSAAPPAAESPPVNTLPTLGTGSCTTRTSPRTSCTTSAPSWSSSTPARPPPPPPTPLASPSAPSSPASTTPSPPPPSLRFCRLTSRLRKEAAAMPSNTRRPTLADELDAIWANVPPAGWVLGRPDEPPRPAAEPAQESDDEGCHQPRPSGAAVSATATSSRSRCALHSAWVAAL